MRKSPEFTIGYEVGRMRRDLLPALVERFSTPTDEPKKYEGELTEEEAAAFSEALFPVESRELIESQLSELEDGTYKYVESAGRKKDGTVHPHSFFIIKYGQVTELYFIDPEHSMGKSVNRTGKPFRRADLRPRVNIFHAAKITEGQVAIEVASLRYQAKAIDEEQKVLNKPREQFLMAVEMLRNGNIPDFLEGEEQAKNITNATYLGKDDSGNYKALQQSRFAKTEEELSNRVLEGEEYDRPALVGQENRMSAVFRTHFPVLLEKQAFEMVE